jgi:putative inorganic carbon (hco3(-)) transporter
MPTAADVRSLQTFTRGTGTHRTRRAERLINHESWWASGVAPAALAIMLVAVRVHEMVPTTAKYSPVLILTAIVTAHLLTQWRRVRTAIHHTAPRLLLALLVFTLLTVPFALYPSLALRTVKMFLPAVVMFVAIASAQPTRQNVLRLQSVFVASAAAYSIWTFTFGQYIAGGRLSAGGGMFDSNDMAALLALVWPSAIMLTVRHRGLPRLGWLSATMLIVAAGVATGSRGGVLGLAAGALVMILAFNGGKRIIFALLFCITAGAAWTAASDQSRARISTIFALEDDYNMSAEVGRKQLWARARSHYLSNPVIGVGAGNYSEAEGAYFTALGRPAKWSASHNAYWQALVELGTAGGGLFLGLLATSLLAAARAWRPQPREAASAHPELLAGIGSYLVTAVFLSHVFFHPLYALLGLVVLVERLPSKRHAARELGSHPHHPLAGSAPA